MNFKNKLLFVTVILLCFNLYSQEREITNIPCSNDFISVNYYNGSYSTDPFGYQLGLIKYRNTPSNNLEYYLIDSYRGNTLKKSVVGIPSLKDEESIYSYVSAPWTIIGIRKKEMTEVYLYDASTNKVEQHWYFLNREKNARYNIVTTGYGTEVRELVGKWTFTVENRKKSGVDIEYYYKWANQTYIDTWDTYFDFLSKDFEVKYYLERLQLIRFNKKQLYLYELDLNPRITNYSGLKIYNIPNSENKSPSFAMARKDNNFFVTFMTNTSSGKIEIYRFKGNSKIKQDDFWIFPSKHLNEQERALHEKKTNDYFKNLNQIYTQLSTNEKVFVINKGYFTYDFVYKVSIPFLFNGNIKYRSEAKIYRIKSNEKLELGPLYEVINPNRKEKIKYEFVRKVEVEG